MTERYMYSIYRDRERERGGGREGWEGGRDGGREVREGEVVPKALVPNPDSAVAVQ